MVTHPSINRAQRCLTSVSWRNHHNITPGIALKFHPLLVGHTYPRRPQECWWYQHAVPRQSVQELLRCPAPALGAILEQSIPVELHCCNSSLASFKKELKTVLFTRMLARQQWYMIYILYSSSSHSILFLMYSLLWLFSIVFASVTNAVLCRNSYKGHANTYYNNNNNKAIQSAQYLGITYSSNATNATLV